MKVKLLSRARLLATPWMAAYQAPPPMGFSRQVYWSGLPLPSLILLLYIQLNRFNLTYDKSYLRLQSESKVTQSCPTLFDLLDCSLPGSSVHGIFQARVLGWGAIPFPNSSKTKTAGHPRPVIMWVWFSTLFSPLLFFF